MCHQVEHSEILCSAHVVVLRVFLWISEKKTVFISLYIISLSVLITEPESVYCAVSTGSLNAPDTVRP